MRGCGSSLSLVVGVTQPDGAEQDRDLSLAAVLRVPLEGLGTRPALDEPLESPAGVGRCGQEFTERAVVQHDAVSSEVLLDRAGVEVPTPAPQDLARRIDQRLGVWCGHDRMVGHHEQPATQARHSMELPEQRAVIGDDLEHADADGTVEDAGARPAQVGQPSADDRPRRAGVAEQLQRHVRPDDDAADASHPLTLATADVQRQRMVAVGVRAEELTEEGVEVGRVGWIVANRVDPPPGHVVPHLTHPAILSRPGVAVRGADDLEQTDVMTMSRSDGVVEIRRPTPDDVAVLVAGRDDEFVRFLGQGSAEPQPTACIVVGSDVVGWVDYDHDRSWLEPDEVNIGYNVFEPRRRQGYATRAVLLLLQHLRDDTPWRVATLVIDPENGRSLAVARRAGFVRVGDVDGDEYWKKPIRPGGDGDGD